MVIAILVIGYVLVLRYLDKKNREKDARAHGTGSPFGPPDYASLKQQVLELSDKLAAIETSYRALSQRLGGLQ